MDPKSLIVGLLLASSLLVLGIGLRKPISGAAAAATAMIAALLSSAAATVLALFCLPLLMLSPEGAGARGAAAAARVRVSALSGVLGGKSYALSANGQLSFGREKCKVLFPPNTPGVSRHHCTLFVKNGNVYLVDNNSQYGTYLLPSMQRLAANSPVLLENNASFRLAARDNSFIINKN
jgi:hypothetical protein